jgi:hypothetical protein
MIEGGEQLNAWVEIAFYEWIISFIKSQGKRLNL